MSETVTIEDARIKPWANLYGANLYGANLYGANLRRADLRGADLRGADLRGTVARALGDTPSGLAVIYPTCDGWQMQVGCWRGTPDDLRTMIAPCSKVPWPEATGKQKTERRPFLANALALAEWHIAQNPGVIAELAAKWGEQ